MITTASYSLFFVENDTKRRQSIKQQRFNVIHCQIANSCHSGLALNYEYFPLLNPHESYLDNEVHEHFDIETDDEVDDIDDKAIDETHILSNDPTTAMRSPSIGKGVAWPNLTVIAKQNREIRIAAAREKAKRRVVSEQLISGIRQLYRDKEIPSNIAKFWEGALGNHESFRKRCIHGLAQAVNDDGVFVAVGKRKSLFEAMFRRDSSAIVAHLQELKLTSTPSKDSPTMKEGFVTINAIDSSSQGIVALLAERLYYEILSLQKDSKSLNVVATHPNQLSLIEDFLLLCGKIGYPGPEMFDSISRRQNLLSRGLKDYPLDFKSKLQMTKQKALIANLMISRYDER